MPEAPSSLTKVPAGAGKTCFLRQCLTVWGKAVTFFTEVAARMTVRRGIYV